MWMGRILAFLYDHHARHEDGGNDEISIAGLAGATKEFFVPVHYASDISAIGGLINEVTEEADALVLVPQDFTSLTSIEVIFQTNAAETNMHIHVTTRYGAYNGGETYVVHTETAAGRDIGATVANHNLAHDISDLVDIAALAAGDLLLVIVKYDATAIATNLYYKGIRFKYS